MLKIHSGLAQLLIVWSADAPLGREEVAEHPAVIHRPLIILTRRLLSPLIVRAPLKLPATHSTLLNTTIPSLRLHSYLLIVNIKEAYYYVFIILKVLVLLCLHRFLQVLSNRQRHIKIHYGLWHYDNSILFCARCRYIK